MFDGVSQGSLFLDPASAERIGYRILFLPPQDVLVIGRCFEMHRVGSQEQAIGRAWSACLDLDYVDRTHRDIRFDLADLVWFSHAWGKPGLWRVSPDIERVLTQWKVKHATLFANLSSGELAVDHEIAQRIGYARRSLTRDELASIVPCFELKRTRYGDAALGACFPARLEITYADGSKVRFAFDPDRLMWACRATREPGVWTLSPSIVQVLKGLGP